MGRALQHKINITWTPRLAYAIGLITSDGSLNKDGRHINFVSKDIELIGHYRSALSLSNQITPKGRGGSLVKNYFSINFGDIAFCRFLNSIGLYPAKSKTIQHVDVPDQLFHHFLRGLFDGDGTFYTFWDRRWPKAFGYQIAFASASTVFIQWLRIHLSELYRVKGFIHKGKGVLNLRYLKGDTKMLTSLMYPEGETLYLGRKYTKIQSAFQKDRELHPERMPR